MCENALKQPYTHFNGLYDGGDGAGMDKANGGKGGAYNRW